MADETDTTGTTAAADVSAPVAPLLAPGSFADGSQAGDPEDWQPPKTNEQGFAIDGNEGWPINLRLRALALADAGKDEDPDGHVSSDAIADAKDRAANYDADYPKLSNMTKAQLQKQADSEGVAVPEDALRDDIQAAIEAARPMRF